MLKKKLFIILILCTLVIGMTGCGLKSNDSNSDTVSTGSAVAQMPEDEE